MYKRQGGGGGAPDASGGGAPPPQVEHVPTEVRLAFFNETRHAYGRTALLLSGGAALGAYHVGVIKALLNEGCMPRVLAGASAGSIVAAIACVHTDDEILASIDATWAAARGASGLDGAGCAASTPGVFAPGVGLLRLDFFKWRESMVKWMLGLSSSETLLSSEHLGRVVRANVGDVTFQEAFDRTGRILNLSLIHI